MDSINKEFDTVFIDLDGVIVDFLGGALQLCGIDDKKESNRIILKGDFSFEDHFFNGKREDFVSIIQSGGYKFWADLKLFPWAPYLMSIAQSAVGLNNIYFLTSHSDFPESVQAKVDYILKYFGSDRIIVTKYKYLCANPRAVLIDDMDYNLIPFAKAGGKVFKWPNQYKLLDGDISLTHILRDLREYIDPEFRAKAESYRAIENLALQ